MPMSLRLAPLIWLVVAVLGAFTLGGIALHRGEPINALWLIVAAGCVYALPTVSMPPGSPLVCWFWTVSA